MLNIKVHARACNISIRLSYAEYVITFVYNLFSSMRFSPFHISSHFFSLFFFISSFPSATRRFPLGHFPKHFTKYSSYMGIPLICLLIWISSIISTCPFKFLPLYLVHRRDGIHHTVFINWKFQTFYLRIKVRSGDKFILFPLMASSSRS